jgi:hypothetical protein
MVGDIQKSWTMAPLMLSQTLDMVQL